MSPIGSQSVNLVRQGVSVNAVMLSSLKLRLQHFKMNSAGPKFEGISIAAQSYSSFALLALISIDVYPTYP